MPIALGYGRAPLHLPDGFASEVLELPSPPEVPVERALAEALARPLGARTLRELAASAGSALIVLSDASRDEPRAALYEAARRELSALPDERIVLAVANGTHGPAPLERLGLPAAVLARHRVVNHDGRDPAALVEVGRTRRGTRVRLNRCVLEADLVVVTGKVKPHYFAGWGGGAKGIFPGLGHVEDIRQNHLLKADPASGLGRADENPCRDDIEEAVSLAGRAAFLLDVVEVSGAILGAVAGDLVLAHREAVRLARPWCEGRAQRAEVVVVSAPLPVSGSLYQASKLIPPAGAFLKDGGVVVVCAECPEGIGPGGPEVVNRAIFELGVRRYLPPRHAVLLVSGMPPEVVAQSYATYAPSLEAALGEALHVAGTQARVLVIPDGGDLVPLPG
ncbi:MAG TPA: lactate racemase domain-containing protein [Anaeromyxobacteraceae bacterium]|jgi:nickel-dependent lactate racemase|nr:lactate racemase domain-containing protein [Anaeromyxobacteraceae bacterium]